MLISPITKPTSDLLKRNSVPHMLDNYQGEYFQKIQSQSIVAHKNTDPEIEQAESNEADHFLPLIASLQGDSNEETSKQRSDSSYSAMF